MATRKAGRKASGGDSGQDVRISVTLSADTWLRLRAICAARRITATDLVAGLVDGAVAKVRLPSVGDVEHDPAA